MYISAVFDESVVNRVLRHVCFRVSCPHKSPPKMSQGTKALREEEADLPGDWTFPVQPVEAVITCSVYT